MSETFYQIYGNRKEGRKEDKSVLGYEGIFMPSSGIQPACSSEWAKKRPDARYVLANSTVGWIKRHRTPHYSAFNFRLLPVSLYPFHLKLENELS